MDCMLARYTKCMIKIPKPYFSLKCFIVIFEHWGTVVVDIPAGQSKIPLAWLDLPQLLIVLLVTLSYMDTAKWLLYIQMWPCILPKVGPIFYQSGHVKIFYTILSWSVTRQVQVFADDKNICHSIRSDSSSAELQDTKWPMGLLSSKWIRWFIKKCSSLN